MIWFFCFVGLGVEKGKDREEYDWCLGVRFVWVGLKFFEVNGVWDEVGVWKGVDLVGSNCFFGLLKGSWGVEVLFFIFGVFGVVVEGDFEVMILLVEVVVIVFVEIEDGEGEFLGKMFCERGCVFWKWKEGNILWGFVVIVVVDDDELNLVFLFGRWV